MKTWARSSVVTDPVTIPDSWPVRRIGMPVRGTALVMEGDPAIRALLERVLRDGGYHTMMVPDGITALELVTYGKARPDIVLNDRGLPLETNGAEAEARLREILCSPIPVIILADGAPIDAVHFGQSASAVELVQTTRRGHSAAIVSETGHILSRAEDAGKFGSPVISVIDEDKGVCRAIRALAEQEGFTVKDYVKGEAFLEDYQPGCEGCLLTEIHLPGMNGIELLEFLREIGQQLPAIVIAGNCDVRMAVQAMKAGAVDFIQKPLDDGELLSGVRRAIQQLRDAKKQHAGLAEAARQLAGLTSRELQIIKLVLAGQSSKNIAAELKISRRTVEHHRAAIMKKTGSKSLPVLGRLAMVTTVSGEQAGRSAEPTHEIKPYRRRGKSPADPPGRCTRVACAE